MRRYAVILIPFIIISITPCRPSVGAADTKSLLNIIKNDQFLKSGNIDFLDFNGNSYLVSVGKSLISGTTPSAKLNAIKEARLIAQENLVKFIYDVQVSSRETLTQTRTIKATDGKPVEVKRNKQYIELIRERGEGLINKSITIGKWKSSDKKEMYYAYGILID